MSAPKFKRHTLAEAFERKDARAILEADGSIRPHGPHVHTHPQYPHGAGADEKWLDVPAGEGTATPVSKPTVYLSAPGDPSDIGPTVNLSKNPMWSIPRTGSDSQQGQTADCYYLATVAALERIAPWFTDQIIVQQSDGRVVGHYRRGGRHSAILMSAWLAPAFPAVGATPNPVTSAIGIAAGEKTYAAFRTGANTYASLNWGSSGAVFSDLGCSSVYLLPSDDAITALIAADARGMAATLQTTSSAPSPLIKSHVYAIEHVEPIPGTNDALILLRNPWGVDGGMVPADTNPNDGLLLFKWSWLKQFTQNVCAQTSFPADVKQPRPGDANYDGSVDIGDFLLLQENFNKTGADWLHGDFNGDGTVTVADFLILQNNFNKGA